MKALKSLIRKSSLTHDTYHSTGVLLDFKPQVLNIRSDSKCQKKMYSPRHHNETNSLENQSIIHAERHGYSKITNSSQQLPNKIMIKPGRAGFELQGEYVKVLKLIQDRIFTILLHILANQTLCANHWSEFMAALVGQLERYKPFVAITGPNASWILSEAELGLN